MALCPVMSRRGEQMDCQEKKCQWWVEFEDRPGVGTCAVTTIALFTRSVRDSVCTELLGIANTIKARQ